MTIMKKILLIGACAAMLGASEAAASGTIDLQGKTFAVDTIAHYYIGPGLTHTHLQVTGNGRTFQAYAVTMDRNAAKGLRVKVDVGNDSCLNAERITSPASPPSTPWETPSWAIPTCRAPRTESWWPRTSLTSAAARTP